MQCESSRTTSISHESACSSPHQFLFLDTLCFGIQWIFFRMQELFESVSVAIRCKEMIAAQERGPHAAAFFFRLDYEILTSPPACGIGVLSGTGRNDFNLEEMYEEDRTIRIV